MWPETTSIRTGCNREDPRFNVWSMMIQRCREPNNPNYWRYGENGRGVCERWTLPNGQGFANFCTDMGARPDGSTLDRRNNDEGYSPENCRWVGFQVQQVNRGKNRNNTSGCKGVVWSKSESR